MWVNVKRPFLPPPPHSADEKEIQLIYHQVLPDYVAGNYPVEMSDCLTLAALAYRGGEAIYLLTLFFCFFLPQKLSIF